MNTLRLKTTLAASLLALSFSALATAGDGAEHKAPQGGRQEATAEQFFTKLDANKDGKVTRKEAEVAGQRLFDKLDKDKNGELSRAEADAGGIAMYKDELTARFKERDKNKDKRLSAEEAQMPKLVFENLDTNKDNTLSLDEFRTRPDLRAGHRQQQFELADKNKDGKLTRAEVTDAVDARFDKADTDHDGVVTRAELEARVERARAQRAKAPGNNPAK